MELVREIMHGGTRGRPTRTLLELIGRLAPISLGIIALIMVTAGGSGVPVALQLVKLLAGLVVIAAVDQWFAAPLRRGLKNLARFAGRRFRRDSLPNPPPAARVDEPVDPGRPV
ncbi:MAG TPA: hypothetical protein VFT45_15115 [Longimicrobium sp.]|nr:hypothetical protein [Longimicrobium sp.]